MNDLDPNESADLAFVNAADKLAAEGIERQRANAQRAWTISGVLAAVVLAAGFTTTLQDAAPITQMTGVCALGLWFLTAILFVRISIPPKPEEPELKKRVADALAEQQPAAAEGTIGRRAQKRLAIITGGTRYLAHRLRVASGWAAVAAIATVTALALTVLVRPPDDTVTGTLLLTDSGEDAVADACEQIEGTPTEVDGVTYDLIENTEATVYLGDLKSETALVRIRFEPGICDDGAMILYLERGQLVGVLDP